MVPIMSRNVVGMGQLSPERQPLLMKNKLAHWDRRNRSLGTSTCVTSKAALLSLVWSFAVGGLYALAFQPNNWLIPYKFVGYSDREFINPIFYALMAILLCFYPLAGYLADIKYGRYKTIIRSMEILLVFVAIVTILLYFFYWLFFRRVNFYGSIAICLLAFFLLAFGFVGFNANIIQFGMDQLHDSPADHQSLYIHWYVWVYYLVLLLGQIPWIIPENFGCHLYISTCAFYPFVAIYLVVLTISLLLAFRKKDWFIIDSSRISPYKLVYKVTKFAWQHKVPVQRSAFTYCEDDLPAGLDLGKHKYGGPFTTEEVENVKAFYGILQVLFSLTPTFFLYFTSDLAVIWYSRHIEYWNINCSSEYYKVFPDILIKIMQYNILSVLLVIVLLPLYLCTIRSSIIRFVPSMIRRIGIGIPFSIASLICMLVLNVNASYHKVNYQACTFLFDSATIFQYIVPLIIPGFLTAMSNVLIYIALYEFICSQSPHSMKGFLIGVSFAIKGLSKTIATILAIPFYYNVPSSFNGGIYFCIMNITIGILALLVYVVVARRYKYRKRDEICDIYRFAEEYYSNTPKDTD